MDFDQLSAERKLLLQKIGEIRGDRDVLVYASDLNSPQAQISVAYADLLPINDQLANLSGKGLDLILETPGGSGEVAEDIVGLLRKKYEDVAVVVPGTAKSAGTLMVMAADEILMEPASSLGPIDAQIQWQGKVFSADALIQGLEAIKEEVEDKGSLNRAFIPILQGISPGELQSAENALEFARKLVTEWLATYKFKNWTVHNSSGKEVTSAERRARAREVAKKLCDHRRWLTHGRSIKIDDLEEMKLKITNYAEEEELSDAIRRYHTLLQMTFDTSIYKIFETPHSQIYRWQQEAVQGPAPQMPMPPPEQLASAQVGYQCGACGATFKLQLNFAEGVPLQQDAIAFPSDDRAECPNCGTEHDLSQVREQVEAQAGKAIVA